MSSKNLRYEWLWTRFGLANHLTTNCEVHILHERRSVHASNGTSTLVCWPSKQASRPTQVEIHETPKFGCKHTEGSVWQPIGPHEAREVAQDRPWPGSGRKEARSSLPLLLLLLQDQVDKYHPQNGHQHWQPCNQSCNLWPELIRSLEKTFTDCHVHPVFEACTCDHLLELFCDHRHN